MNDAFFPRWMMKTLGFLLIIFIFLLILNQWSAFHGTPQIMRVSAEGKVTAIPDLATIVIGVTSTGNNAIEVKNQNNQKINQIISFIKQEKIDPSDIKTSEFYAYPQYNYHDGQRTAAGYQADQMLTVKIKGIDKSREKLEKILDGAVNTGANKIQGVNFSFSDTDQLKQLARKKAISNAKIKAQELATDANLKLGKIINVLQTSNVSNPSPYPVMNFSAEAKSIAPKIEIGNQEIIESITLVFLVS